MKFKPGDKVRCIGAVPGGEYKLNAIYTIKCCTEYGSYLTDEASPQNHIGGSRLELVEEKKVWTDREIMTILIEKANIGQGAIELLLINYPTKVEVKYASSPCDWNDLNRGKYRLGAPVDFRIKPEPVKKFPIDMFMVWPVSMIDKERIKIGCQIFDVEYLYTDLQALWNDGTPQHYNWNVLHSSVVFYLVGDSDELGHEATWDNVKVLIDALKDYRGDKP